MLPSKACDVPSTVRVGSGGLLLAQPLRSADFAICAGSLSDLLRRNRDRVCMPVLAILRFTTALVQNTINLLLVSAKH